MLCKWVDGVGMQPPALVAVLEFFARELSGQFHLSSPSQPPATPGHDQVHRSGPGIPFVGIPASTPGGLPYRVPAVKSTFLRSCAAAKDTPTGSLKAQLGP